MDTPHLQYKTPSGEKTLPFVNQRTRAQIRVVDYYPPDLRNFSQSLDQVSYNDCPPASDEISGLEFEDSSLLPTRWEWNFYLLVEDARPSPGQSVRMPLLVTRDEAVHLLKRDAVE
jgi:protection-of-telomeres protein 1